MRGFDQSLPMALLRARESVMGFFRPLLNEHGLTEQQWRIIRVLQEHRTLEFHALARLSCIQPPSLSGMLTRLERMKLLRRHKVAGDRRRLHITLSREGGERYGAVSQQMEIIYRDLTLQFGARRLATLFKLLRAAATLQPDRHA
jgi:homoprotocatechuate degradation regulator HpaR